MIGFTLRSRSCTQLVTMVPNLFIAVETSFAFKGLPQISYLRVPVRGHRLAEPLEIEMEVQ